MSVADKVHAIFWKNHYKIILTMYLAKIKKSGI